MAPSSASPLLASPRDLILITILLFLSSGAAAAATAETADSPVYLSSAPFSLCFSLSLRVERRTLVLEIDEVAHCARGTQKTRVLIAIFNASRQ